MTRAREKRLRKAEAWISAQNFTEEARIIKAYRKHFKVDKLCAVRELGMLGILSPEKQTEYEAQWRAEIKNRQAQKQRNNDNYENPYQDNNFFFIAGHTSGGVPYGLTWEEEMKFEQAEEKVQELQAVSRALAKQDTDPEATEATEAEIEKIEALLEAPYWIIDILPEQVPADSGGQYFAVEEYFLQESQRSVIKQKHANVILKLNCCEDIFIEGEMNPTPKNIVKAIKARHIDVILDDVLITSEPDDTYMTIYNASEELLELLKGIAASEGLFVWQPDNMENNTGKEQ